MDLIQIILGTIIIGLLLIIVIYFIQNFEFKNTKPETFLIVGHNNSGKTGLFYKLINKPVSSTVSSIEPNFGNIRLPFSNEAAQSNYQIIDYPGYLKYENLFKNLVQDIKLKGVIFLIDSDVNSFNKSINTICKKLFRIMSITELEPDGINYLIGINKSDLFNSLPKNKIRANLETEMNKVINNELHQDHEEEINIWHEYLPFKFENLKGNVEFMPGSVLKNQLNDWQNWMDQIVVN